VTFLRRIPPIAWPFPRSTFIGIEIRAWNAAFAKAQSLGWLY
jgi:hypothetical protein